MSKIKIFYCEPVRKDDGKIKYTGFINSISSPIFKRLDTGEEIIGTRHPGMCYDDNEFGEGSDWSGPDGRSLVVILPDEMPWYIDGPTSRDRNIRPWQRTGKPEDGTLDVNPSILTDNYHGFLRRGYLESC